MTSLYYLVHADPTEGESVQSLWRIGKDEACELTGRNRRVPIVGDEDPCDAILRDEILRDKKLPAWLRADDPSSYRLEPCYRSVGDYHPLVYRPTEDFQHLTKTALRPPHDEQSAKKSIRQLSEILGVLYDIFKFIEPDAGNLLVYGQEIRSIILISCTEFENQCRSILRENSVSPVGSRFTTQDYVKLLVPLKLGDHEAGFQMFPTLGSRAPFKAWHSKQPTVSLDWYNAYNAVKHDREAELSQAKLQHAVDAVAACAIMLFAQFGVSSGIGISINKPEWPLAEHYVNVGDTWQPIDYPF